MIEINISVDSDLTFFLPKKRRQGSLTYHLDRRASIKDIIESQGVPHTEIGEILFNGNRVDFNYLPLCDGQIKVSAISPPFDVCSPSFLRPDPFHQIKFIADVNVIRLGKLMILLGFDVLYSSWFNDQEVANIAQQQERIVLTRDTQMLKRNKIVYARRVRENRPYDQLLEVLEFFGLQQLAQFFSRCVICNLPLKSVEKKEVMHCLEPKTKKYYHSFKRCLGCGKIYWKGSHYEHIKTIFQSIDFST